MKEISIMPDIICKWEILLTSPSILKSCLFSSIFQFCLVFILFKKMGLGADYLLEFCNRVLV